jgi:ribose transport system substrate-binding protein
VNQFVPDLQPGRNRSPRYYIKVLGKALRVLDALHHNTQGLRLADIAEAAQLDMATALRILHTLQRDGWVSRDPYTKKYNLPLGYRTFRVGYAQLCSGNPFSEAVSRGLAAEARKHFIDLLIVDNKLDAEIAVQNAEWMIEQHVDFAIEFQIHYRVAPVLAEMFRKARIPTLAIDIPQPGAIYFGVDNYAAGQLVLLCYVVLAFFLRLT